MTTKDASFPPRCWLVPAYLAHEDHYIEKFRAIATRTRQFLADEEYMSVAEHERLLSALREENARLRKALEQAEAARAEGEEIGRLKQRLEYAEFKASDPGEHHAIRTMARETIAEIKAKLEALAPKGEVK